MGEPIALAGHPCPELFSAAPHESKSIPQRLKPSSAQTITARLNPCPSFDSLCPSLSGAVQIGEPTLRAPVRLLSAFFRGCSARLLRCRVGKMCALSALCALSRFLSQFGVFCSRPVSGGAASSGRGLVSGQALGG